jgi:hypothetical protein
MEFFIILISVIGFLGVGTLFGILFMKIEKDVLNSKPNSSKDFQVFMGKVKGNSARLRF